MATSRISTPAYIAFREEYARKNCFLGSEEGSEVDGSLNSTVCRPGSQFSRSLHATALSWMLTRAAPEMDLGKVMKISSARSGPRRPPLVYKVETALATVFASYLLSTRCCAIATASRESRMDCGTSFAAAAAATTGFFSATTFSSFFFGRSTSSSCFGIVIVDDDDDDDDDDD